MAGKPGRSGRPKDPTNTLKYFNEQFDKNSYDLINQLFKLALEGNKDILTYCFDRRLGRPHQTQDLRVKAQRVFSPEELELINQPLIEERQLLDGWGERRAIPEKVSSNGDNEAEVEGI